MGSSASELQMLGCPVRRLPGPDSQRISLRGYGVQTAPAGQARLWAVLWAAMLDVRRHNPLVRSHYECFIERGRCKMSALGGSMRKLVHICFGVIKNQTDFQKGHLYRTPLPKNTTSAV